MQNCPNEMVCCCSWEEPLCVNENTAMQTSFLEGTSPAALLDKIEDAIRSLVQVPLDIDEGEGTEEKNFFSCITTEDRFEDLLAPRKRRGRRPAGKKADELVKREEEGKGTRAGKNGKIYRRRQIDPTTCERDYSHDECEFMKALEEYKRTNGRNFPTCSETLEVIRQLGYVKMPVLTETERDEGVLFVDNTFNEPITEPQFAGALWTEKDLVCIAALP